METKSARLTVLIDPVKKDAFEKLCAAQDLTPSQVVRQLIREYLEHHNAAPKPFAWTADADLILRRVRRVCERISDSGH